MCIVGCPRLICQAGLAKNLVEGLQSKSARFAGAAMTQRSPTAVPRRRSMVNGAFFGKPLGFATDVFERTSKLWVYQLIPFVSER